MAIVSFWNNNEKETGQTLASVAVATMMAIDHNHKILEISTGFGDKTVENCFWEQNKGTGISIVDGPQVNLNTGIEGLIKIIQSNRTSSNIVSDYAKVVFKDRFDVLPSPESANLEEYNRVAKYYPDIVNIANRDYNLVFVDIDKKMDMATQQRLIDMSDVVIVVLKQGADVIESVQKLRQNHEEFRKKNVIFLVGKWDKFSKYNTKNITRELREKKEVCAISYNTLFYDASTEGKVADFFLRYRSITDKSDRNLVFMEEAKRTCDSIIYKLQELQMRM